MTKAMIVWLCKARRYFDFVIKWNKRKSEQQPDTTWKISKTMNLIVREVTVSNEGISYTVLFISDELLYNAIWIRNQKYLEGSEDITTSIDPMTMQKSNSDDYLKKNLIMSDVRCL
jgi:hypothetical protein